MKARLPHFILVMCSVFCLWPSIQTMAAPTQLGDLDDDQIFTANDLAKLIGHSSGTTPLPTTLQPFADLNQDGFINSSDHDALISLILESSTPQTLPLARIREVSPATGEGDVAVTRETVLHFSMPLALTTALDTTQLYAEFGGRKILSRVDISSDKKKATLFYLEPLPSNARIRVTFDSTGVTDLLNRAIDGDGDGQTGGTFATTFDTLSITAVAGTAISGRVFASEPGQGAGGVTVDVPLAGVTITVDGAEETLRAVTDAQGNFTLHPAPAGSFFVHVDGRTSPQSSYPNGNYYPAVGKRWEALAGRTDNLSGNSQDTSRGTIYLPQVIGAAMAAVSQSQDIEVAFPASVLTDNPALAGTELKVPANSLFADDGTRGGRIGIAPVAADRLPSPLPPGLNLPMVITIQTDGATNFDRPVPITFPNLPDPVTGQKLPPGAKSALWSFNHDLGDWEVVGPMTVTEDGNFVKTDAGVGVRQPGWHGTSPGCPGNTKPEDPCNEEKLVDEQIDAERNKWLSAAKATSGAAEAIYTRGLKPIDRDLAKGAGYAKKIGDYANIVEKTKDGEDLSTSDKVKMADDLRKVAGFNNSTLKKVSGFLKDAGAFLSGLGGILDLADAVDEQKEARFQMECCLRYNRPCIPGSDFIPVDLVDEAMVAAVRDATEQLESQVSAQAAAWSVVDAKIGPETSALEIIASDPDLALSSQNRANTIASLKRMEGTLAEVERLNLPSSPFHLIDSIFSKIDMLISFRTTVIISINPITPRPSPDYALFAAVEANGRIDRFRVPNSRSIRHIFSPSSWCLLSIYDPVKRKIGHSFFESPTDSRSFEPTPPLLLHDTGIDSDGDELSDDAEKIIGSDAGVIDTDQDGVPDGAECVQGTNPLNGLLTTSGLASAAPTRSAALDIAASNGTAMVAHGSSGFTLFNVLAGLNPGRLLEQDTQGFAQAVALSGSYALIADREGGAVILDLRDQEILLDPARRSAALVPVSVGGEATAVAADGVTGYVGTSSGQIVVLDLSTRREVSRLTLPSGSSVEDLQVEGEKLYALQTNTLRVLSVSGATLALQGSLGLSLQRSNMQVRFRLFVGNGLAYATHSRGYHLVDVTTPTAPSLVRSHSDNQFGWKQMIQNGSGLGLACASPNSTSDGPHHLSLYSVGTDGRSSDFLTTIETPGIATAVSVYNGLAYVADGSAGLQVVNYRAFDTLRVPPTIQLASNFNLAGGSAEEGKRMRLTATVTDDVQVRNVEFYVDGTLSATDGDFPFEHAFLTPVRSPTKQTFTVRAKATDTGGNIAWSTEYTLNLIPDATPPTVASVSPQNNSLVGAITETFIVFSEPMNVDSLSTGVQVTGAGPDGTLGNADDTAVPTTLSWRSTTNTAFLAFASALTPGRYQIRIASPGADLAGNALASATTSAFRVFSFTDTDNDGMADDWESLLGLTIGDDDSDNDGILDGAEDFDNDGLSNAGELVLGFDPRNRDTNGNGIDDGLEDIDQDGLTNQQEFLAGTNPNLPDTDGDGWKDGDEVAVGSNPTLTTSRPAMMMAAAPAVHMMRMPALQGGAGAAVARSYSDITVSRIQTGAEMAASGACLSAIFSNIILMSPGSGQDLSSKGAVIQATPKTSVRREP